MSHASCLLLRWVSSNAACAAVLFCGLAAAQAQSAAAENGSPAGRIDFDDADLPPATVEVDLSQGMFNDLFGLGDAAIAGVAESLLESAEATEGAEGTRLAAEQLAAARQIMQLASEVVQEVRIRVYEDLPEDSGRPEKLLSHYDEQLRSGDWETIVRVRDGEANVRVSLLREEGAVRGAFVVALENENLVLANIVGDISPENVKKLTSAATKVGLENGLQQVLEQKMRELNRQMPPGRPSNGARIDGRGAPGSVPPSPPPPPTAEA
jgi:Domain of unknown function (DUF4252)